MPDFARTEQLGWWELVEVDQALEDGSLDMTELWQAVAQGDHAIALTLLAEAGWEDLPEPGEGQVSVILVPDDLHGERARVWVVELEDVLEEPDAS